MGSSDVEPLAIVSAGGWRARRALLAAGLGCAIGGLTLAMAWWVAGDSRMALAQDPSQTMSAVDYLRARPLDAIGLVSAAAAMDANAARPLEAAAEWLSPFDPLVALQQAQRATAEGNDQESIRRWLKVATLAPERRGDAFSQLERLLPSARWKENFPAALKSGWPAASEFVSHVCAGRAPASTALSLAFDVLNYRRLSDGAVNCVSSKAISAGLAQEARWFWINSFAKMPTTIGNVYDGSFDGRPGGNPFDWTFSKGGEFRAGFVTSVVPESTRGQTQFALSVRFNGRPVEYPIAQQVLALAPGNYTLRYLVRESGFPTPSNVSWMIRCLGAESVALTVPSEQRGGDTSWTTRSARFTVPANCPGQVLRLELGSRLDLLQGLNGTLYFDDITAARE